MFKPQIIPPSTLVVLIWSPEMKPFPSLPPPYCPPRLGLVPGAGLEAWGWEVQD